MIVLGAAGLCFCAKPASDPYAGKTISVTIVLSSNVKLTSDAGLQIIVDEVADAGSLFQNTRPATTETAGNGTFIESAISNFDSDATTLEWRARILIWPFDAGLTSWSFDLVGDTPQQFRIIARVVSEVASIVLAEGIADKDVTAAELKFGPANRSVTIALACLPPTGCLEPYWQNAAVISDGTAGMAFDLFVAPRPYNLASGAQIVWVAWTLGGYRVYGHEVLLGSVVSGPATLLGTADGGAYMPRIYPRAGASMASWVSSSSSGPDDSHQIWVARWNDGGWSSGVAVPDAGGLSYPPSLAGGGSGVDNFLVAWLSSTNYGALFYSETDGGTALSAAQTFSPGDPVLIAATVAGPTQVDNGSSALVFQGCNQFGPDATCRIGAAWRDAGIWSPIVQFDQADAGALFEPAVIWAGGSLITWKRALGTTTQIWAQRCNAAGSCSVALVGTAANYPRDAGFAEFETSNFSMGGNSSGESAVAWNDLDAGLFVSRYDIGTDAGWRPAVQVAPVGSQFPRLGVTPSGRIVIVWANAFRVFARWYDKSLNNWWPSIEISNPVPSGGDRPTVTVTGESAYAAWSWPGRIWGAWSLAP